MRLNAQQIAGYAQAAGFPPAEIVTATAVALAESGGETTATNKNTNGSIDYGLWQINTVHGSLLTQGDKFNPLDNARMAYTVWDRAGKKWTPWTVYKTGAYLGQKGAATIGAANPSVPEAGTAGADPNIVTAGTEVAASPLSVLGPLGTALGSIVETFNRLTSGGLWLRIGAFMVGSLLIVFSLLRLSGADQLIVGTAKTAVKVAAKGAIK